MNNRPITEDDHHAYVDDVLEPERRAEVGSYLADHPDVAKRVAGFADQRELLRAALAPIAAEPLPPELNLSRIVEGRRRRSPPAWWHATAERPGTARWIERIKFGPVNLGIKRGKLLPAAKRGDQASVRAQEAAPRS